MKKLLLICLLAISNDAVFASFPGAHFFMATNGVNTPKDSSKMENPSTPEDEIPSENSESFTNPEKDQKIITNLGFQNPQFYMVQKEKKQEGFSDIAQVLAIQGVNAVVQGAGQAAGQTLMMAAINKVVNWLNRDPIQDSLQVEAALLSQKESAIKLLDLRIVQALKGIQDINALIKQSESGSGSDLLAQELNSAKKHLETQLALLQGEKLQQLISYNNDFLDRYKN